LLDLFRRHRAALRQRAHFGRNHREAAPLLARLPLPPPRSAPGCWSECDAVDHADDVVIFFELSLIEDMV